MPGQPTEASAARREPDHCLVVVAASVGGLAALTSVLKDLPPSFPGAIVVVQHLAPDRRNLLPELLAKRTRLRVVEAGQNMLLEDSTIYVAPPDRHVVVTAERTLALVDTPRVNYTRPAADLLFESAARVYGARVVAVVLTGGGVDATAGVKAIKRFGGTVIAQDQATSTAFGMPGSAIASGSVDLVLPISQISTALIRWASERV